MEFYLRKYYNVISNCEKGSTTIDFTKRYLLENEIDIKELLNLLPDFPVENIINLYDLNTFCSNNNKRVKCEKLIKFFNFMYSYAKNLMINYGFFSSISLQDTNESIVDCLKYIPDYKLFLSKVLGYNYDHQKKEFIITDDFTIKKKFNFSAVCLACAYAHTLLTEMKEAEEFSITEIDPSPESLPETQVNINWICDSCTFSNNETNLSCMVCFEPRKQNISESLIKNVSTTKVKSDEWMCTFCSFINENKTQNCSVCEMGRISQTAVNNDENSKIMNDLKGDHNLPYWKEDREEELSITLSRGGCDSENLKWSCDQCTLLNEFSEKFCTLCNKPKLDVEIHIENVDNENHSKNVLKQNNHDILSFPLVEQKEWEKFSITPSGNSGISSFFDSKSKSLIVEDSKENFIDENKSTSLSYPSNNYETYLKESPSLNNDKYGKSSFMNNSDDKEFEMFDNKKSAESIISLSNSYEIVNSSFNCSSVEIEKCLYDESLSKNKCRNCSLNIQSSESLCKQCSTRTTQLGFNRHKSSMSKSNKDRVVQSEYGNKNYNKNFEIQSSQSEKENSWICQNCGNCNSGKLIGKGKRCKTCQNRSICPSFICVKFCLG